MEYTPSKNSLRAFQLSISESVIHCTWGHFIYDITSLYPRKLACFDIFEHLFLIPITDKRIFPTINIIWEFNIKVRINLLHINIRKRITITKLHSRIEPISSACTRTSTLNLKITLNLPRLKSRGSCFIEICLIYIRSYYFSTSYPRSSYGSKIYSIPKIRFPSFRIFTLAFISLS